MVKIRVDVKNAFALVDNGSKHFLPGNATFSNRLGVHVHDCDVYIIYKDKKVDAKKSWDVYFLGIEDGDEIWFEIEGNDEYVALSNVLEICKSLNVL